MATTQPVHAEMPKKLSDNQESETLSDIIITARKIRENIDKVPISTTVKTVDDLVSGHIQNTQDLSRNTPNFNFSDSGLPFANLINIRGIGSSSPMVAPSVIYYVDGIPIPTRIFDQRFLEISQIEVLRGPQGMLFGLNAQSGVVNIKTAAPTSSLRGEIGTEFGSYNRQQVNASISGPLSSIISGRLNGQIYHYGGDIKNYIFDSKGNVTDNNHHVRREFMGAVSGKLVIAPDAITKITLSGNYRRDRERPTTGILIEDSKIFRSAVNPIPQMTIKNEGVGVTVEHDFDKIHFTSVTGFQHYNIGMVADLVDGFLGSAKTGSSPYLFQASGLNVRKVDEHDTQLTQEFRLDGTLAGGIRWVAGLSAFYSNLKSTTYITSNSMANGAYSGNIKTTNLATFGEVTIPLYKRLSWIGGLRATYEKQNFDGVFLGRAGSLGYFEEKGHPDYAFLTGRTGLTYALNNQAMLFVTVSRGEKTGGYLYYNQFGYAGMAQSPYKNAKTWAYEAGFKSQLFDKKLHLSASIFFNQTKNEQLFTYNSSLGRISVENAPTQTYGGEIELQAKATKHISFGTNLAFLHAVITGNASGLKNNRVPYAPSFSSGLSGEYHRSVTLGKIAGLAFGRVEYQYMGTREIDPANSLRLKGYGLVNLRIGLQTPHFDISGYISNIAGTKYVSSASLSGTSLMTNQNVFSGNPGRPRSFGISAKMKI